MAEEIKVGATGWVHIANRRPIERAGTWLIGAGIKRYSDVHELAIGKRKKLILIRRARVAFVVVPDFVKAEVGSRQQTEIYAGAVGVYGRLPILQQKLFGALMNCG